MNIRFRRVFAAIIDFALACFLSTMLVCLITLGNLEISALSLSVYFVSWFFFMVIKDSIFGNASVGKRILKICIVKTDGADVSTWDASKRSLTILLLPIELLMLIFTNKRIGDIWANTAVRIV